MATQDKDKSQEPGTRAPKSVVAAAPRSHAHRMEYGNDAIAEKEEQKDGAGMPAGYKADTSVSFHAGKKGEADQIQGADGEKADVTSANAALRTNVLGALPKDHTYRDRVEAQAKSLGIEIDPAWTLEYLLDVIRWKASS